MSHVSRVVAPNTRRLRISGDDWLLVKERLNSGEDRQMRRRGRADAIAAGLAFILAYVLDWSVRGLDGKVVPFEGKNEQEREAALDSIDPDTYTEILRAVEAHELAVATEREEEKKLRDGVNNESATSPSLEASAGASSGSGSSI